MEGDEEATVVAFFLLRGHTLDEMTNLSSAELMVYRATMIAYMETIGKAVK